MHNDLFTDPPDLTDEEIRQAQARADYDEKVSTAYYYEELERRAAEERTVALVRRDKGMDPPPALLLDRGEATLVLMSLTYFGHGDPYRIVETPETLADLYQNLDEFDAAVLAPIKERHRFRDQARILV